MPPQIRFGREFTGFTDDPRILDIALKIFNNKLSDRDIGVVYGPIQEDGTYSVEKVCIADSPITITSVEDVGPPTEGRVVNVDIGRKTCSDCSPSRCFAN